LNFLKLLFENFELRRETQSQFYDTISHFNAIEIFCLISGLQTQLLQIDARADSYLPRA